jgi:hypothetical protein
MMIAKVAERMVECDGVMAALGNRVEAGAKQDQWEDEVEFSRGPRMMCMVSKVVIEGSQDSREMTENDLKVINEKVIAVLRIV